MSDHQPVTRRHFLLGIGAFGAVAVGLRAVPGGPPAAEAAVPPPTTTTSTSTSTSSSTTFPPDTTTVPTTEPAPPVTEPPPPVVDAYVVDPRDVYRDVKQPAGHFAQLIATHPPGAPVATSLAAAIAETGALLAVADVEALVAPLFDSRGVTAEIVSAQLGGLSPSPNPSTASVMVGCRQTFADGAQVTRTIDVRMARQDRTWQVVGLASVGGSPVPRPADLSPAAAAVLDHPRIDLPDSARWDIHEGFVDERLLTLMAAMAERTPYAVTCLRSGHPVHVFGTDRVSHHTRGAAVDIWGVDGTLVAAQQPDPAGAAHELQSWLYEQDVSELGGPWDLDGRGGRSFTNEVHLDHIHIGFRG